MAKFWSMAGSERKEVVSKGIEFQSADVKMGETLLNIRLNYNFNPVEAVKDFRKPEK